MGNNSQLDDKKLEKVNGGDLHGDGTYSFKKGLKVYNSNEKDHYYCVKKTVSGKNQYDLLYLGFCDVISNNMVDLPYPITCRNLQYCINHYGIKRD